MRFYIEPDRCVHCGACALECEYNSIDDNRQENYFIILHNCVGCGDCYEICPVGAIVRIENQ
ncbi:4Fe-4S binding protein [uncultured Veillonella sp.]|uniref:4Fe-4S binding protein n=1 Tax=uncultured Veillonella sp. TaxID=159268 RepID=UPI0034304DB2